MESSDVKFSRPCRRKWNTHSLILVNLCDPSFKLWPIGTKNTVAVGVALKLLGQQKPDLFAANVFYCSDGHRSRLTTLGSGCLRSKPQTAAGKVPDSVRLRPL